MIIAIDVGGTTIRVASYTSINAQEYQSLEKFSPSGEFEADVENIIRVVNTFKCGVDAIGIGVPGTLNRTSKEMVDLPNITSWNGRPIVERLKGEFNVDIVLENDAVAAALSEAYGQADEQTDFWYVTWGTGLGGALVKYIDRNIHIFPSELGHQRFGLEDDDLEAMTGGGDIERQYNIQPESLNDKQWEEVEENVALGVINILSIINTPRIVFGGGVSIRQPVRIQNIQKIIKGNFTLFSPPGLSLATGGEDAGVIGAKLLTQKNLYSVE